ncbi:MAG: TRAP transporter permease, partial [Desulfobacteraceae bacterium]|nr:TRAP transporter permease [Desulfobacteraceae bacterium]
MTETGMSQKDAEPKAQFVPAGSNTLVKTTAWVVMVLAVSLSLYQLYTAGVVALTALVQRSIHLGAILSLTFLLKPAFSGVKKNKLSLWL